MFLKIKKIYFELLINIRDRPNISIAFSNSFWLLADRIIRVSIGLFVGAWIARYLGPSQFGVMNYALAVVAMVGSFSGLGLSNIVVRDLVRYPAMSNSILGTTFILQICSGLTSWLAICLAISYLKPNDGQVKIMVLIFGSACLFKSSDVIRYWFDSKVQSRDVVIPENLVMFFMALVKIVLIYNNVNLMGFVWVTAFEGLLISFGIVLNYSIKTGGLKKWIFDFKMAFNLTAESWPLMLAIVASMVSMKLSQIMLGSYADENIVGNYAAATRVAEVWLMIPSILGPSIFPFIISLREKNHFNYHKKIILITKFMLTISIVTAFLISLGSNTIISILYGDGYELAGLYLSLLIWSGVPYIATFSITQMFFIEGLVKYSLHLSVLTGILTVGFNFILIPLYGGIGAAISSILVAVITSIFSCIIIQLKTKIFSKKYI